MARILANGLRLEVEARGNPAAPTVLLIMGLGMQLVAWPESLCRALLDAGFRVIRFDNRDVGVSEGCEDAPRANLMLAAMRWMLHLPIAAPYTIETLAEDARGVLDAMGARQAHVVGVSLGGMVAQSFAAAYPERCLSLASIMASSGARHLPPADLGVLRQLLLRPRAGAGTAELAAHFTRLFQAIGTPGQDPAELEARVRAGVERSYRPDGTARQLLAVLASGDRSAQLARIVAPTLVLHGDLDPLVPPAHGEDCARKIPGARWVRVPGMGHDLADAVLPDVIAPLLAHLEAARAAGQTRH